MDSFFSSQMFKILGKEYPLPLDVTRPSLRDAILLYSTMLFARNGYAGVSIKDLTKEIGITPAALYNYFDSKDQLWKEVIDHTERLYRLYFANLDQLLSQAETYAEALDLIFEEPIKMSNHFTCFAFSLVVCEQLRDPVAFRLYDEVFMKYSIDILERQLERFAPERARIAATVIMSCVFSCIVSSTQQLLSRKSSLTAAQTLSGVKEMLLICEQGEEAAMKAMGHFTA